MVPLRLANLDGRATLLVDDDAGIDLASAGDPRFGSDPMAAFAQWDELRDALPALLDAPRVGVDRAALGPPVPRPPSVFAIGLNYRDHAAESGLDVPTIPMVFTKFPSCLTGPDATVELSGEMVDWEVELVAVIGRGGRRIDAALALGHVAGYCVGQDLSDRLVQFTGNPAQFSIGKSFDGFGPIGPAVVDASTIPEPQALRLWCDVGSDRMQNGTTADMVFGVAELVAYLSSECTLQTGDLIFTGTPSGIGASRSPARFLGADDVVTSGIDGLGHLVTRFV